MSTYIATSFGDCSAEMSALEVSQAISKGFSVPARRLGDISGRTVFVVPTAVEFFYEVDE